MFRKQKYFESGIGFKIPIYGKWEFEIIQDGWIAKNVEMKNHTELYGRTYTTQAANLTEYDCILKVEISENQKVFNINEYIFDLKKLTKTTTYFREVSDIENILIIKSIIVNNSSKIITIEGKSNVNQRRFKLKYIIRESEVIFVVFTHWHKVNNQKIVNQCEKMFNEISVDKHY